MPDKDGYHTTTVEIAGRVFRWHHCSGAEGDELVLDTPTSKLRHLKECRARQQAQKARQEKQRTREAANRLRTLNRHRKEGREK